MMTNTVEQNKNTESCLVQLDSKGEIQWISLNPYPIKWNAAQIYELLREKDTILTYKQAIIKTWKLLKYLLALIFYLFLLGIALIITIWGIGYNLGVEFRKWLESAGEYQLNLISLDSVDALPKKEKNLVIVAKIKKSSDDAAESDDFYHVRIFNRNGNKIIDKGEGKFLANQALIEQLDEALGNEIDQQKQEQLILDIFKNLGIGYTGRQTGEFFEILLLPIQKLVAWANHYVETHLPGWKLSNCKCFETPEKKEEIKH